MRRALRQEQESEMIAYRGSATIVMVRQERSQLRVAAELCGEAIT
jgi:hypothetical protein